VCVCLCVCVCAHARARLTCREVLPAASTPVYVNVFVYYCVVVFMYV